MLLADYLDVEKLRNHINTGLVTARRHNTLPLTIYCYGRKAVFDQIWDDVTTRTRGLIVDDAGVIVARPYEKFFSLEQLPTSVDIHEIDKKYGPPTITEKVNGCLGIFWKYGIHWGVASKGSFHSPHAEFATKWLEDHVEHNGKLVFPDGYTPVFEIICQEIQPHVIKYTYDGLYLLNFVKIETGEELGREETDFYGFTNHLEVPYTHGSNLETALMADSDRYEGLVATYNIPGEEPFKLKIKFPTFLENRKKFYAEQKLKEQPEISTAIAAARKKVASIVKEALTKCTTQKEFAEFFLIEDNRPYAPACFAMLNYDDDKEKQARAVRRVVDRQQTQ